MTASCPVPTTGIPVIPLRSRMVAIARKSRPSGLLREGYRGVRGRPAFRPGSQRLTAVRTIYRQRTSAQKKGSEQIEPKS